MTLGDWLKTWTERYARNLQVWVHYCGPHDQVVVIEVVPNTSYVCPDCSKAVPP